MPVKIGSARVDENGKYVGGKPGDQTGKEVCTQNYYLSNKGWNLLRPNEYTFANRLANAMQQACDNDNVGYSQSDRYSVINMLKQYGTLANIKTPCNGDCSSLVRACVIQASGKDPGDFNTSGEASALLKTGLFSSVLFSNGMKMFDGDVLVTKTKGHTAIVTKGDPYIAIVTNKSACPYKEPTALTKKGSKGEAVLWLQWYLVKWGYLPTTTEIDGDFGSKTHNAVIKFQTDNGLEVDGKVGPATRKMLKV